MHACCSWDTPNDFPVGKSPHENMGSNRKMGAVLFMSDWLSGVKCVCFYVYMHVCVCTQFNAQERIINDSEALHSATSRETVRWICFDNVILHKKRLKQETRELMDLV